MTDAHTTCPTCGSKDVTATAWPAEDARIGDTPDVKTSGYRCGAGHAWGVHEVDGRVEVQTFGE